LKIGVFCEDDDDDEIEIQERASQKP